MKTAILLALILLPLASALEIQAIYYDAYNEAGSEFVLLKNTGDQVIDLTGYAISTPSSANDATLNGLVLPGSTFLVTDAGWENGRDNTSWPESMHEETLTLSNSDGYVQLVDNFGTIIDTIGYGNVDKYQGEPHSGVAEGKALVRISSTNNNLEDFEEQDPFSQIPKDEEGELAEINVTVENTPIEIEQIRIDSIVVENYIELISGQKQVLIEVDVADNNTLENSSATVNNATMNLTSSGVHGTFYINATISQAINNLTIRVTDGSHQREVVLEINWISSVAVQIPNQIIADLSPGQTISKELTIENVGSVPLDFQIQGTKPKLLETVLGSVSYNIAGTTYGLTEDFRMHPIGLGRGEQLTMNLNMTAGFVPAGTYSGQIVIVGVAS